MKLLRISSLRVLVLLLSFNDVLAQLPLPNVTLPWGTWQARDYDSIDNIYTFANLRYGKSPTGPLRFQRPHFPDLVSNPQSQQMDNEYGPMCHRVTPPSLCASPLTQLPDGEDCLFLDVYVSQSVWENAQRGIANATVVVWVHGGGFEFGAKSYSSSSALYKGHPLIAAAQNHSDDFIFVVGNYRLGVFGWLAGPTMETQATANAGLYDQRLMFEWVQKYIHLFGGNNASVSAWGESAGASSIVHHLISRDGQQDPLFQSVFLQSPAIQWNWDRSAGGTLDQVYNNVTVWAGCPRGDHECLVNVPVADLLTANQVLYNQSDGVGMLSMGPSVDGDLIRTIPPVAFQHGLMWQNLDSLALSHTVHEAQKFIPAYVKTEADFPRFLNALMKEPELQHVRDAITSHYPAYEYQEVDKRVEAIMQDSILVCNPRFMWNAYNDTMDVYLMNYAFAGDYAIHAADHLATFAYRTWHSHPFIETCICPDQPQVYLDHLANIAPTYQSYLADLAVYGNPGHHSKKVPWAPAHVDLSRDDGDIVQGVLTVGTDEFNLQDDTQSSWDTCSFWYEAALNVTSQMVIKGILHEDTAAKLFNVKQRTQHQQFIGNEL